MDLTVNPAYPSITNALLRGDILEEDYTQIDIVSSETAEPSYSSSASVTFNPAYPRVTNALLSSDILEEDYTEVDIVSNETAQRRSCSSSSSEQSYVEVQPVLDYEEIADNNVSGVRSEQNCAYNITSDDPPPAYEEVVRSRANSLEDNCAYNTVDGMILDNQEVYEVIPEREEEDRTETYTPRGRGIRTLCRFWQGRVELAIRVTIISLGLMALVLPILGAVYLIPSSTTRVGLTTRGVGLTTVLITLFITVPCIPCPQLIVSCVELGMLLARICSKKIPEGFLVWDMVHSGILCALCLIGCVESVATLGLWSAELARLESGEGGIINTEISIYTILTAVCLASAALYLVRACWIRAAIKGKWDEKN